MCREQNKRRILTAFFPPSGTEYTPNILLFEGESRVECTALTGVSVYYNLREKRLDKQNGVEKVVSSYLILSYLSQTLS